MGVKIYTSMLESQKAFEKQKQARRLGVGPPVGKLVMVYMSEDGWQDLVIHEQQTIFDREPTVFFGYTTRLVKPVTTTNYSEYERQYDDVVEKLKQIGIKWDIDIDLCDANFGFYGKSLVCIDFGSETYTHPDIWYPEYSKD